VQYRASKEVLRGVDEVLLVLALGRTFILGRGEDVSDDLCIAHCILARSDLGKDVEMN